jgi:hypothetical protein
MLNFILKKKQQFYQRGKEGEKKRINIQKRDHPKVQAHKQRSQKQIIGTYQRWAKEQPMS